MYARVCVHQSEPAAISPPVCARSLSFTLTHLSAPACPHRRSKRIQLEDHDSWHRGAPAALAFNGLVFVCFFLETLFLPSFFRPRPRICYGVGNRCCRFTGCQKAPERVGGLMGCVIFVYISARGIRRRAGMLCLQPSIRTRFSPAADWV